jgi:pimeloyl-ACP methyl ester carboxylesterase/DNA-binding CsgD family transcriptional regulator
VIQLAPYTQFFTTAAGTRIAYATTGDGPPLVYLPPFLSHLELMWDAPAFQAFNEALGAHFTLIRYDRYGCGLSDRDRADFSLDVDVGVLADLIEHLRLRRVSLLAVSAAGRVAIRYAVANPRRLSHLLLFGIAWKARPLPRTRAALHQLMRADWRIGANSLADYLLPSGDATARAWFARIQREATDAATAAALAEAAATDDLSDVLPQLRVPTLVLNRRDDRFASLEDARELAARIPGARFITLEGDAHIPEFGDAASVVDAIRTFMGVIPGPDAEGPGRAGRGARSHRLSERELEVVRLIATGLTNREIAERLSLSIHTVERHTVNIYTKLGVRSRAAATAWALQHALIRPASHT